jgi:hypothetical protein
MKTKRRFYKLLGRNKRKTDCKELPDKDHTMCGKERFIRGQTAGLSLLGSEHSSLAGMGSGLYRRGQAMGEGESLWSPIICDQQMEQVDMPS